MRNPKLDWLEISHHNFTLPRLGGEFDGFRLAQISDIHFGTWIDRERLDQVVDILNELEPDVLAITGDFVSESPDRYYQQIIQSLRRINVKETIFAVLGNHDHWTDAAIVTQIVEESGIVHLQNSTATFRRGSSSLHFAGLDCHYLGKDRLDLVLPRLPEDGAAILLVHEPDFADRSAQTGRFDLQISGHSHGGQFVIPRIGPPFLPRFARKYPLGLYHLNGMIQYTNRGIGTSHLKLRINCPAEISIFTLKSPAAGHPIALEHNTDLFPGTVP